MLVKIPEDSFVITQRQDDHHEYVVGNGRIYSRRKEAEQVYQTMVKTFDALVASGNAGAWRPTLRAIKWAD